MDGRTRRSGRMGPLLWTGGVAGVLFVILVLPFLLVRNQGVRSWLLDSSLHRGLLSPEWRLRIDRVERFDPGGIELRGVHLAVADSVPGEWLSLGRLGVRWKTQNLVRRRLWADRMTLDSLVIDLSVKPPSLARSESVAKVERRAPKPLPWLRLDSLSVRSLTVRGPAGTVASGDFTFADLEHDGGSINSRLVSARMAYEPESLSVSLEDGIIEGVLPRQISVRGASLQSTGLQSTIAGELFLPAAAGDDVRADVTWELERLRPVEVAPLRRIGVPWTETDTLAGLVHAEFAPPLVRARMDLFGLFLGAPLGRLQVLATVSGDTVTIQDLSVGHRIGSVAGDGQLVIRGPQARGRFELRDVNLGDPALSGWIPDLPAARFGGVVEGSYVSEADGAEVSLRVRDASFEALGACIEPIRLGVLFADRVVRLDSLRIGTPTKGIAGGGSWDTRNGSLRGEFDIERAGFSEFVQPFVVPPIGGEVTASVRIEGTTASPSLFAIVEVADFHILDVSAPRLTADSVQVSLFPFRLRGNLRAQQPGFFGVQTDSASFAVAWDKTLRVQARVDRDTLSLATTADIVPADPGSLTVEELVLAPGSLAVWRTTSTPQIRWDRGRIDVEDVALACARGRIAASCGIGSGGSAVSGSLSLEDFDLALVERYLQLPDSTIGGLVDIEARLAGSIEHPEGGVRVEGRDLVAARWPIGPLSSSLSLESGGVLRVDTLTAGSGHGWGKLLAEDMALLSPVPFPEFLRSVRDSVRTVLRGSGISGRLQVRELSLKRLAGTGLESVSGGGRTLLLESVDPMTARIRTVGIGDSAGAVSVAEAIGGNVGIDVTVGGAIVAPRVHLKGKIQDLYLYQARADSLLFGCSYAPQELSLDSLVWCREDQRARAHGSMPMIISPVLGRASVPQDRPLSFDASLPVIDLAILGVLSRQLQEPRGTLSGSLALRGTPRHAWAEGSLSIRDGGIRIPKREERLRKINGEIALDSTGLRIVSLTGRVGEQGRINVGGWWRDPAHFNLDAKIEDATFFETGLYHVKADGNLAAFPVEAPEGAYPLIVGTVDVEEGAIIGDLAKQPLPPPTAGLRPSPLKAEIDVNAPGNLRISTAIASVQLGEGEDLHVSFADPLINVSGRIRVLGGRYRVFNNVFTITDGTVEFRDTGHGPEPILDVNAQTRVTERGGVVEAPQEITVLIHATGPITALNLEFSSQPERTQDEVVELLSIGRLTDPTTGSVGVTDPSRQYLFTELVSQIESQITQLIAPLEGVQLQPGEGVGEAWKLSVRQTLLPQVSVAYSRELAGAADQGVSLHYNLRGQLYLNAGLERRMEASTPTDRYTLDLKLRFEYK